MDNIFVPGAPGTATAQEKILCVTRSLGIRDTDIMQATTRTIFDTLPVDGRNIFNFFQGCNNRAFPLTNLSQNRLEVGEAMIIKKLTLNYVVFGANGTYELSGALGALTAAPVYDHSLLNISVANSVVLKDFYVGNMHSLFNQYSKMVEAEPYELRTLITIPSLQEFIATLKTDALAAIANNYIKLTIEGIGIIYKTYGSL